MQWGGRNKSTTINLKLRYGLSNIQTKERNTTRKYRQSNVGLGRLKKLNLTYRHDVKWRTTCIDKKYILIS